MEDHKDPTCNICMKQSDNLQPFQICESCMENVKKHKDLETDLANTPFKKIIPSESIEELSGVIEGINNRPKMGFRTRAHVRNYYHSMNEWLDTIQKLDELSDDSSDIENTNDTGFSIRLATYCSFGINCFLLLSKAFAISTSASYTIMSSLADSCLDIIGGIIISITAASSQLTEEDKVKYPVGKSRVSTVGILVFSVLMSCCAILIILQCLRSLLSHEVAPDTTNVAVIVMIMTIIVKLLMWIFYTYLGHPITLALASDHRNDVLTNSFGLFMYWGGAKLQWWMDSAGGLLISLFVLQSWVKNATENARMLMGERAPSELIRNLTYIAAHHNPLIKSITNVIAYQIGPNYFAELSIVFRDGTSLEAAQVVVDSLKARILHMDEIESVSINFEPEIHHEKVSQKVKHLSDTSEKNDRELFKFVESDV
ncbi:cation efflux family protein [Histomonas meleagridis]|uniref:cation efflux family protein n=1 Tax=Histomonas meleagridis TaxID=135588 RepID=UPI0035595D1D|nr:cation efflux family protein [Histomonas meleagridis]KAH0805873.1 cation efflux family protein [Histomonas meleagridis]